MRRHLTLSLRRPWGLGWESFLCLLPAGQAASEPWVSPAQTYEKFPPPAGARAPCVQGCGLLNEGPVRFAASAPGSIYARIIRVCLALQLPLALLHAACAQAHLGLRGLCQGCSGHNFGFHSNPPAGVRRQRWSERRAGCKSVHRQHEKRGNSRGETVHPYIGLRIYTACVCGAGGGELSAEPTKPIGF